jgi:hypothetical protein
VIIVYCCALILAVSAVVLRGRIVRLGELKFRHGWLIWAALADQVLVISIIPGGAHGATAAAHVASYAAIAAFVWANRRLPGGVLVFIGGALNAAAILTNGGIMPASKRALLASGWTPTKGHFANSAVVPHAHLKVLGDIFATPRWLPGHDVFSIGDLLVAAGVALLVAVTCTRTVPVPLPVRGLGIRQRAVLALGDLMREHGLSAADVASALAIGPSNARNVLKRLEAVGYVVQVPEERPARWRQANMALGAGHPQREMSGSRRHVRG